MLEFEQEHSPRSDSNKLDQSIYFVHDNIRDGMVNEYQKQPEQEHQDKALHSEI